MATQRKSLAQNPRRRRRNALARRKNFDGGYAKGAAIGAAAGAILTASWGVYRRPKMMNVFTEGATTPDAVAIEAGSPTQRATRGLLPGALVGALVGIVLTTASRTIR